MIRLFHAYFPARTVLLGVSEAVLATLAYIVTKVVWFGPFNTSVMLTYEQGFAKVGTIVLVLLLCMYYFDLYDSMILSNRREIFIRLIQVLGTVCVVLAPIYWAFPGMNLGQPVFLIGTAAMAVGLLAWRRLFFVLNRRPEFAEPTLIIGDGLLAEALVRELDTRPELGWRVVAHLGRNDTWLRPVALDEEMCRIIDTQHVSRVIVTMSERRARLPIELLLAMKARGIAVQDGSEVYEVTTGKIALEALRPSWLVFSPGFTVSRGRLVCKRIFSLVLSSMCLFVTAPLMLLIAFAIRIDSRGPVIFCQRRVGEDGKTFTLYKFRSMHEGVDRDGNFTPAGTRDGRCTRVGRWLRATRLDELPQLVNIFRGDMYFVGPRPFVPNQEDECVRNIPFYKYRWTVKPGATGWAQVNRGYCATLSDNAEKLAYDLFYIKNMSIGLDLLVLFKTIKILLLGRGGR
jgi:exopolysaccharide biosynthesis polyprenyl glycosylphosphotransferase